MEEKKAEAAQPLTRREFLLSTANVAILSVLGFFIGFPLAEVFLSHMKEGGEAGDFVAVAKLAELQPEKPLQKAVIATRSDAWNRTEGVNMGSVWLVKRTNGEVEAFSSVCPHLGCIYGWNAAENIFVCPCHISGFDLKGTVLKGPAPRPLDALDFKIEGDQVLVRYQRFISGIPQKKVI